MLLSKLILEYLSAEHSSTHWKTRNTGMIIDRVNFNGMATIVLTWPLPWIMLVRDDHVYCVNHDASQ